MGFSAAFSGEQARGTGGRWSRISTFSPAWRWIGVLVAAPFAGAAPLAPPRCDTAGMADLVPVPIVQAAARQRASARWETFALGEPIPCSDEAGRLTCWQVPVALGTERFPDLEPPAVAGESADSDPWGVDRFWTFVVSARYADYPVFVHYQGLPPLLATFRPARQKAGKMLGTDAPALVRYVFRGQAGTAYVFAAPDGRTATLDAETLEERAGFGVRSDAPPTKADLEKGLAIYRDQTRAAWDAIEAKAREDVP